MTGHEIGKQSDDDILYPHSLQCNKKGRICKASCCEYRVIDCHDIDHHPCGDRCKNMDSPRVLGIFFSSVVFLNRIKNEFHNHSVSFPTTKKTTNAAHPSDSGQVTFIV